MNVPIYLVICSEMPLMIIGAYKHSSHAHTHARTITGGSMICVELLVDLPPSVRDLINEDFEDDDTPVVDPNVS